MASKVLSILLALGIVTVGALVLASSTRAARTIDLYGFINGWRLQNDQNATANPAITINASESVTFVVHAEDAAHNLLIDLNGNNAQDTGEQITSTVLQGQTAQLAVNIANAGAYNYICTLHGTLMKGTLTVAGGSGPGLSLTIIIGIAVAVVVVLAIVAVALMRRRGPPK